MMKDKERFFLALIPNSPLQEQLMELKHYFSDHYQCKAPLRSPAHITLHMPFSYADKKMEKLKQNLTALASRHDSFDLKLNGFGAFPPRVIYVSVEENQPLRLLQKLLMQCMKENGIFNADYKDRGYNPHITIAFRDLKKALFPQAWAAFENRSFDATFKVPSFWLLKHDGKKWHPYKEFLLQG